MNKLSFIKRMISVFDRKRKIQLVLLLIAIIISAILELIGVTVILPFINIIVTPEVITQNRMIAWVYNLLGFQNTTQFLVFIAIGIMIVYIVKNFFLIMVSKFQFQFTYNNQRRLAHKIAVIYMGQDYLFHTKHNRSELMRDINDDTSMFFRVVLCSLQLITELCICGGIILYLFIADKTITIGMALIMLVFVIFYLKVFKKKIKYYGVYTREKQAEMNKSLLQCLGGVKETKILNCEKYFTDRFDGAYAVYADHLQKNNLLSIIPKPVVEALCIGGMMMIIAIKLCRGVDVEYFVPTLTTFAVAFFRILPSFNKITMNLNSIVFGKASVDAVFNTMQKIKELEIKDEQEQNGATIDFTRKVEIQDLSFRYPGTERFILEHANFSFEKNKSIAFIGPSGAGKTTMADLLLGIIKPTSGKIVSDGGDVTENIHSWQRHLGYIPQSIYLLDDTLRRNVALGIPDDEINDDKIWNALENAQLDEYVRKMPDGLDTIIGENGILLSGGQRQRIGIARALYHNPEILILDEATSALDNETEAAVMDAINRLGGKKTLIIIAHRLSTIEKCDYVFEIKEQKAVQVKK